ILYGEGISRFGELIDLGVAHNLVEKAGSWYSYNGDRVGQGKENARQFLKDNPTIADELEAALRAKLLPQKNRTAKTEEALAADAGRQASQG
ncbi:MAG TPA: DNA recombination/repair protein RecA, partial [Salinisphaeraceae bacterium]|nr:DNA recombination/repair protein RecA [Salinisphaeraceae bacterium]